MTPIKRWLLRFLGFYVEPTERERMLAVVGRTRIEYVKREWRGV